MKFISIRSFAAIALLLDHSAAINLRKGDQKLNSDISRELQGSCGGGNRGNEICADPSLCCSEFGWCGSTAEYCGGGPLPDPLCGNGVTGTGVCADTSLCCSQYGYCGSTAEFCGNPPDEPPTEPTPAPITPLPPMGPVASLPADDSRLIAYLGGWTACPSDEQLEQYTHIMIAFAVSYTYSPGKNICSTTCEIATPSVCVNAPADQIQRWQAKGKKIILSFGGAGMGGSWDGLNDCWEYCFGRETQVIDRLTDIAAEMGIDGVDIDYEYYYEDGQNNSRFNKGVEAQKFLTDVTLGLRQTLPEGAELTHAPMDSDMVPGKAYYDVVLRNVASSLDFLMPQYYNGVTRPGTNFNGALQHFTRLRDEMFGGDASKIVFGFCINECGIWDLNGSQAASVMQQLDQNVECNGGAFFWMSNNDVNGAWSTPVRNQIQSTSDQCSASPIASPTASPTESPTSSPTMTPTSSPTASPTGSPTLGPTTAPTSLPTASPIESPTSSPTTAPTVFPTAAPTSGPTISPTESPTSSPTFGPTTSPTAAPTASPTFSPTTAPTATLDKPANCVDDIKWLFKKKDNKNCEWVARKNNNALQKFCVKDANKKAKKNPGSVLDYCKSTCWDAGFTEQCQPLL